MHVHCKWKDLKLAERERVLWGHMTITAEAEKSGQELFIKTYVAGHHSAVSVGPAELFDDDIFYSVSAGDPDHPPKPGGYIENMENSVSVQGFEQVGKYGGVVDGMQISPGTTKTIKGIIFTGG